MTEKNVIKPWEVDQVLKKEIQEAFLVVYGNEIDLIDIPFSSPPQRDLGDISTPVCLKMAKKLKQAPLGIAEQIKTILEGLHTPYIKEITISKPGFLNFIYDYREFTSTTLNLVEEMGDEYGSNESGKGKKYLIEHTNINPNKAAHIGHLRNACLGDTLARMAEKCSYNLEIENYVDDTGTAVADVIVGLYYLDKQWDGEGTFDYFCWDMYAEVNQMYVSDPSLLEKQAEVLHMIEAGDNEVAKLAKETSTRILDCHLATMARLGIYYDLLTWESDIIHLGFWQHAFKNLQKGGGVTLEEDGPNAGCWVVKLGDIDEFKELENPDKILIRSNGIATYTAKDAAYQMWKFGVLGKDFLYKEYSTQLDGKELWTTALDGDPSDNYGRADVVVNVIDIRQKYLQDVLKWSLYKLGFEDEGENSIHFGYEIVALSPSAAAELGVPITEAKDVYAMAGRKGIGVKADDMLDRISELTTQEVAKRHPELSPEEHSLLGEQIAVGAVRYYMVRYNVNTVIVFDFEDALSLQGNTGPYLQYAHARAANILRKADVKIDFEEALNTAKSIEEQSEAEKVLISKIVEMPVVLKRAADGLAPSILAEYTYQLANCFMTFYEAVPVLVDDLSERNYRLQLVTAFKQVLQNALYVLGIPAPERM